MDSSVPLINSIHARGDDVVVVVAASFLIPRTTCFHVTRAFLGNCASIRKNFPRIVVRRDTRLRKRVVKRHYAALLNRLLAFET